MYENDWLSGKHCTLFAKENSEIVDNMKGMIDYVHVIPSANRVAYITRFHAVGDIN